MKYFKHWLPSIDSKGKYIRTWILIYIIVLIIGVLVAYINVDSGLDRMERIARYDKQYYSAFGEFNPNVEINGAHNYIYNADGTRIADFPDVPLYPKWDLRMQKIFPKVVSGNGTYSKIVFVPERELLVGYVIAYPLDDGGMFVFLRDASSFFETLTMIALAVAIVIVIAASYIYLVVTMQQKTQKMQREYVDNITHELKSPIASVRALTETMYDGLVQDEEKRKRYYKIILNEMRGLENTVSNMLELSKIQNHQVDCSKIKISAEDTFRDVIDKYTALCEEKGIQYTLSPTNLEFQDLLLTNPSLASRIMDILLDNAVKFTPKQGQIQVTLEEDAYMVTVSISDNGPGISPEDQAHIFGRFYQGDKSHKGMGSGLGLSIATEIAGCLDEKLWLRYSGSNGTAFAFTIHKA